jgi:hypothetical protein
LLRVDFGAAPNSYDCNSRQSSSIARPAADGGEGEAGDARLKSALHKRAGVLFAVDTSRIGSGAPQLLLAHIRSDKFRGLGSPKRQIMSSGSLAKESHLDSMIGFIYQTVMNPTLLSGVWSAT